MYRIDLDSFPVVGSVYDGFEIEPLGSGDPRTFAFSDLVTSGLVPIWRLIRCLNRPR